MIAKKYILKDNDWRLSIRNQGVMTEVWLSAVTLVHGDGTGSVTVPVTSEGSSRTRRMPRHPRHPLGGRPLCPRRPRAAFDRPIAQRGGDQRPTAEQAEALRCETIPALLLVGFEPHPGSTATFATAVRSLVALRHVEPPKPWNEAAKMGSIADAVLEALTDQGLLRPEEELWLLGALTPRRPGQGLLGRPGRARRADRPAADRHRPHRPPDDPGRHHRQTTKQRITNKFKLEVAAALILRAVSGADEGQKVSDIYRALQTGFADSSRPSLAGDLPGAPRTSSPRRSESSGEERDRPASLELAARAAFPLVVSRQLFPDRGTQNNDKSTGVSLGRSSTGCAPRGGASASSGRRSRTTPSGRPSALSTSGDPHPARQRDGEQIVTDNWLRQTFPPPGRPVAPPAPDTAHERYLDALARLGEAMDAVDRAVRRLVAVEGVDGRPLIQTEGVDPLTRRLAWRT